MPPTEPEPDFPDQLSTNSVLNPGLAMRSDQLLVGKAGTSLTPGEFLSAALQVRGAVGEGQGRAADQAAAGIRYSTGDFSARQLGD
jgi:hypothetical protein